MGFFQIEKNQEFIYFMSFFACPKKDQKKTPENDNSPFSVNALI